MSITDILSIFSFYCVFKYLGNLRKQYNFSSNATVNYDIEEKYFIYRITVKLGLH